MAVHTSSTTGFAPTFAHRGSWEANKFCLTVRKTFTLNTGAKIPAIGLGTWQSKPNEVRNAVKVALQKGYRHIDTALAYENEHEVGQGIKDSGVPRSEIWVTTKLDNTWHHRVNEGIDSSLKSLGMDYVDLYLIVT